MHLIAQGGNSVVLFLPFFVIARNPLTVPLLPAQNQENVDKDMLQFEGREEEIKEALRLIWDWTMLSLEASAKDPKIPCQLHPPHGLVPCGRHPPPGRQRPPFNQHQSLPGSSGLR